MTSHLDTPALRAIDAAGIGYEIVRTKPARSVEEAAARRGVSVGALIKTLVVRRGEGDYFFVLVPGDRVLDWSKLRTHVGARRLSLPEAAEALAATGYERGAITPFGATTAWPVVADAAIAALEIVSLGGGAHGVSVKLNPADMIAALGAAVADVTKPA